MLSSDQDVSMFFLPLMTSMTITPSQDKDGGQIITRTAVQCEQQFFAHLPTATLQIS
jgi:hypothetical protein